MKQHSKTEKAKVRKKFEAYFKEQSRTKAKLIKKVHTAAESVRKHPGPDEPDEAWFHRTSANSAFVEKRGAFSKHVVSLALSDPDWETKEPVAVWLRKELKRLREAEAKPGAAPVRRNQALSRLEISEVAIDLLEPLAGEGLVCLFQELLDVDRHRKSLADDFVRLDRAANMEAQMRLQGLPLGVRELAKCMSVAPSTVTRWRKSKPYKERVQFYKIILEKLLREHYFEQIRVAEPGATDEECFRRAFQMYVESVPHRQKGILRQADEH